MSRADQVYIYTASKLEYLHSVADTGLGRGLLANIRRGVGKYPGELPELWGLIFERLPEELFGTNKASYAEWAIYTALTLYAMHQQGNEQFMHVKDVSLGKAAAQFAKGDEEKQKRILQKLYLVATAVSFEDLAYHFRNVIQILSGEAIGLDYARLAKELYLINYDDVSAIATSWGRDFYRYIDPYDKENNKEGESNNE